MISSDTNYRASRMWTNHRNEQNVQQSSLLNFCNEFLHCWLWMIKVKVSLCFKCFFLRRNACLCHYDTLYLGKTATYNYLHLSNPVTSIMGTTLETSVMSMKLQLDIQYTCHSLQLTPSRHREVTGIHSTGNKSKSKMYETDGHNFFPEATDAILNSMWNNYSWWRHSIMNFTKLELNLWNN